MNNELKNGDLLYTEKKNCCGCGACVEVCPKNAIHMAADSDGYMYPEVDTKACIGCKVCVTRCHYRNPELYSALDSYAAAVTDEKLLRKSASGGVFSAVASKFLERGGVVCGAAMRIENNAAVVKHIAIDRPDELFRLQGSKYVQSDMQGVYAEIHDALNKGREVLFSGTPCQVSAVRSLFAKQYGNQLYLMDLICHGVPNIKMLNDELRYESNRRKIRLTEWIFRDKQYGWGCNGSIEGESRQGIRYADKLNCEKSVYYQHFLKGTFYRESCYSCPFACGKRAGDVTIGDFWGVEDTNPELLSEDGIFSKKTGVSCMLVNTKQGEKMMEQFGGLLKTQAVEYNNIAKRNTQLRRPVSYPANREKLLKTYETYGYKAVYLRFHVCRIVGNCTRFAKRLLKRILQTLRIMK